MKDPILPRPSSTEAFVLYQFLKLDDWIDENEISLDDDYPYSAWNVVKTLEMMGYEFEKDLAYYGINDRNRLPKKFRLKRGFGGEFRAELQVFHRLMQPKFETKEAA
jgi:hypothetical protein